MKKKLLTILLGIIICIITVLFKNGFSQILPLQEFGMPGLIKQGTIDNLFVGSSLFKQGIDPNEIKDNDYILAYNGNEPSNIEHELEYLLKNDIKINNLYVDMYVWTMTRDSWIDDLNILWDGDLETIINIYNDLSKYASLGYAYEFFISANNDYLLTYPISCSILNKFYYKGGNNYYSAGQSKEYLEALQLPNYNYESKFFDKQINAIKHIKQMCDDNNIILVFLDIPKYIKHDTWDTYQKYLNDYKELLDSLNIKYILSDEIDVDKSNPDYFIDLFHMSSNGKKEYTAKLVNFINQ